MSIVRKTAITSKPLAFYVPKNLDWEWFAPPDRDYVGYLLNLIRWKWVIWKADARGYSRLSFEYLRKIVPERRLSRILRRLEALGVIDVDARFLAGQQSKGFKLLPDYWQTQRQLCEHPGILAAVNRAYQNEGAAARLQLNAAYPLLNQLDIDLDQAHRIIATLFPNNGETSMPTEEYRAILSNLCQMIADKAHEASVDRYGRFHSLVTRLARPLRCCLTASGQQLVHLDVCNSQPLIAGIVAREYVTSRFKAASLRNRSFLENTPDPYKGGLTGLSTRSGIPTDLQAYLELAQAGTLYEAFMQAGADRDTVKRSFLTAMYGQSHWRDAISDQLARQFPSITQTLLGLKKVDYRHASRLMQNVEACIFMDRIVRQIRRQQPTLFFTPIHDSILTIPSGTDRVQQVIKNEFAKLGIYPTVKGQQPTTTTHPTTPP